MQLKNKYGNFSDNDSFYSIHRPDTPCAWPNFLYSADGEYQVNISQRGIGKTVYHHGGNLVSLGRNYCILNRSTGSCWSLNAGVAPNASDSYQCDHYPGKTIFHIGNEGLQSKLTVVLSPDHYLEVNQLELKNQSKRTMQLSLIGYQLVELTGNYITDQVETTHFAEDIGAVLCQRLHHKLPPYKYAAFFVSDFAPNSYCGSWPDFMQADMPFEHLSLWSSGVLPNVDAYATKPVMALQHEVVIEPGESLVINYGFGIANDFDNAENLAREFLSNKIAEESLKKNDQFFAKLCGDEQIKTPDCKLNQSLNVWSKLQLYKQVLSARDGMIHSWRNNLQDAWGWAIFEPQWLAKRVEQVCAAAWDDGFMPRLSPKLPGIENEKVLHADIATWVGVCAARYAKETGDLEFFNKIVKYADGKKKATVIQCIVNGLQWLLKNTGTNGLILMLGGDWSDPLEDAGKKGIGESPWTTVALINAIKELNPLLLKLGMDDVSSQLNEHSEKLTQAVNDNAWDGQWYIRGITDDGVKFCTSSDPDANVSLMMQAWAIISGVVPSNRIESVIKAVDSYNKSELGPILYGPPFLKPRIEIGRETVKKPGTGENGSVYTHAAMMWVSAEIAMGRADEALKILQLVQPIGDPAKIDIRKAIPLWWANFFHGPHSNFPGRSSGLFASGAPAWFYLNVCEGLLGVKPDFDVLKISPCFPSTWEQATFTRQWRNSIYEFNFERKSDIEGVVVELDGQRLASHSIEPPVMQGIYYVNVYVGK